MVSNAVEMRAIKEVPPGMGTDSAFAQTLEDITAPAANNPFDLNNLNNQAVYAAGLNTSGVANNEITDDKKAKKDFERDKLNRAVRELATQDIINDLIADIDKQISVINTEISQYQGRLTEIGVELDELDNQEVELQQQREELTEEQTDALDVTHAQGDKLTQAAEDKQAADEKLETAQENQKFVAQNYDANEMMYAEQAVSEAQLGAQNADALYNEQREVYLEQVTDYNRVTTGIEQIDQGLLKIEEARAQLTGESEEINAKIEELEAQKSDLMKDREHLVDVSQRIENGEQVPRSEVYDGLSESSQGHADQSISQDIASEEFGQVWQNHLDLTAPPQEEPKNYVMQESANDARIDDPDAIKTDVNIKSFGKAARGEVPEVQSVAPQTADVTQDSNFTAASPTVAANLTPGGP